MRFLFRAAWGVVPALLCCAWSAHADDLSIRLQARSGTQEQTASGQASNAPPGDRPALAVKSGASVRVQWSVANGEKSPPVHDVTMHCFFAREQSLGQRELPKLGPDAAYESALSMDFDPKSRSSADFVLQAPGPGVYLLRVETIGAAKEHGHEHYAAMDVKVQ